MATNFPASLDTLTNPTSSDSLSSPSHSAQHANVNDAVEALQAKVGVDGSAVTTSIDYQLNTGYRYHSTVYFTSSGTFTKASYPWLRAIQATVIGGGGGGGGTDAVTGAVAAAAGGGAGGGGYAVKFVTDIAGMSASETVTVGAGGNGVSAGDGTDGTASSFLTVTCNGGTKGGQQVTSAAGRRGGTPGSGGTATGGDLNIQGRSGTYGIQDNANVAVGGEGGGTPLGHGGPWIVSDGGLASSFNGEAGRGYGGGGGGAAGEVGSVARLGGNGTDGIVILELFA